MVSGAGGRDGGALPPAPLGVFPNQGHAYTPPKTLREIRRLARTYGEAALHTLAMLAGDSNVSPAVRATCCALLLERGYGKVAPEPGGLPDDSPSSSPSGRLSRQDLATMDDATLASVLMDEVGRL